MYSEDISANQSDSGNSDVQPSSKRRRKKSMVWEYFTIEKVGRDCLKACCKLCKKTFAYMSGSKMSGTSHLKRHITMGICPVSRNHNLNDNPLALYPISPKTEVFANGTTLPRKRRASNAVAKTYFNADGCNYELAKMIIQHDYPLHMVEHSRFVSFARMLQPQFNIPSISALQELIMDIYFREKQMVLDLLSRALGRLNLTINLWNANEDSTCVLLTGHFVDHDWKLHKRILNVITLEFSGSEMALSHAIVCCLDDWKSKDKVFTLTADYSHANGNARENLRNLLPMKNSPILNGQLLINSCYARLLQDLALDAIGSMKETVEKVRHSVKYVKTSKDHEERFTKLKQQLRVPSAKNLIIDDLEKWDTTYQMLTVASELKEVFPCLDTYDPDYQLNLSMEDWRQVETLCTYLKLFQEAASILTSPVYPTSNLFFQEAWKIHLELMQGALSRDFFVWSLTKPLQERFSRYWEDCNMVLAIAVAMDPRFKMKLVEFSFRKIYGDDYEAWYKIVDDGLHELYMEYVVESLPPPTFMEESNEGFSKPELSLEDGLLSNDDSFSDFYIYVSDIMSGPQVKSELDLYLEEKLMPRYQDFDVLGWWKENRSRYPTLSKLAADVLSIQLVTVSAESVFDTRDRPMESHLTSLNPVMLETMVCAKDWLQHMSLEVPVTPIKTEF